MKGYIDGIDWVNAEAMKYWSFPSSYSQEKRMTEAKNSIFSGKYWGAIKVDGYYERIIKDEDGNIFMVARNKNTKGEAIDKHEWLPHLKDWFEEIPNGTCLLCECYLPGDEGSKKITSILGCLKEKAVARQDKTQKLHLYVFDIMAFCGENWTNKPAIYRFDAITSFKENYSNPYVEYAEYHNGNELWNIYQNALADGREGIVITREDTPVYFKRTPAHTTIKLKKELQESVDAVVIGVNPPAREYKGKEIESWKYWEDIITGEKIEGLLYKEYYEGRNIEPITKTYFNTWAGSLKLGAYKNGEMVYIGSLSGMTDEVLSNWKNYIGRVVEVTAMEIMDTGGLRHPKFVRWKAVDEKNPKECLWSEIFRV